VLHEVDMPSFEDLNLKLQLLSQLAAEAAVFGNAP
jgi:hypothetical protein